MKRFPLFKTSLISRLFGLFASTEFASPMQISINKIYVKAMNVDLQECNAVESYVSLNKLFTRALNKPRLFDTQANLFISPSDSFISACGKIEQNLALQVKGFSYDISRLLGDYISKTNKALLLNGEYINFYLSPKDYHRYHVPIDMTITKAVHIPGKLYPVNMKWLQKVDGLFCENERVILECYTTENKLFYMIFVGALNVGKMGFSFDERIQTNAKSAIEQYYNYNNLQMKKGEELGLFEMGSTIVMLFENDSFTSTSKEGLHVKFGDQIGTK